MSDTNTVVLKRLESIQTTVDRIDRDLGGDRKDIDKLMIRQGKIEEQLEMVMDLFRQQTTKIKDTVKDSVKENIEPMVDKVDTIEEIVSS